MVGKLLERMFSGDSTALVNHLIEIGQIGVEELDELDELKAHVAKKRKVRTMRGRG